MDIANLITISLQRSVYFVLPFLMGVTSLLLFRQFADKFGMVDKPTDRKAHVGNVPTVGGPAMFLAIFLSASMLTPHFDVLVFLVLCLFLLLLGVADDRLDLPAYFRMIAQATVATAMVVYADLRIEQVGNIMGTGPVGIYGTLGAVFTIVCTIGVINSVNMIDGVDGLAASVLGISFAAMAILAWNGSDWLSAKVLVIILGAIASFLMFNARIFYQSAKVFMGDSGSMVMGFILVWFLISLTQGYEPPISPVVAGWIFGLPLLDTIVVMTNRIAARKSPFTAGRDHLHHRLLDNGFSVNQTVLSVCAIHVVFVSIGMFANAHRAWEPFLFMGFVACVVFHSLATSTILKIVKRNHGVSSV